MKYIFLDVDGVLNNVHTTENTPSGFVGVSRKLVKNLAEIIKTTEAKIVLISDWKIGWEAFDFCCTEDAKYLNMKLAQEGLRIYAKTYDEHVYDRFFEDRGKGIKRFLAEQKKVDGYVVIDDHVFSDFDEEIKNRLIQTDSQVGLSEQDVKRAIEILQK